MVFKATVGGRGRLQSVIASSPVLANSGPPPLTLQEAQIIPHSFQSKIRRWVRWKGSYVWRELLWTGNTLPPRTAAKYSGSWGPLK